MALYSAVVRMKANFPGLGDKDTLVYIGPPGGTQVITPIDPTNIVDTLGQTDEEFYGPLIVGSAIYVWGSTFRTGKVVVYKSTNGGVTFTPQDVAHSPSSSAIGCAIPNVAGNTIIFGGNDTVSSKVFLQNYNLNTDTWGAQYATGGTTNGINCVRLLSTGTIRIITLSGTTFYDYADFASGVWGADTQFSHIGGLQPPPVAIQDPSDGITLIYRDSGGANRWARHLSVSGVLNTQTLLDGNGAGSPSYGNGIVQTGTTKVRVPLTFQTGGGADEPNEFTGQPYTAPVWTSKLVNPPLITDCGYTNIVQAGGTVSYFVLALDNPSPTQIYQANDTGSGYGAYSTFYNSVTSPPPGLTVPVTGGGNFYMEGLSVSGSGSAPTSPSATVQLRFEGVQRYKVK